MSATRISYKAIPFEAAEAECRGEHVFRHAFAANCYYSGMNVKVLSKLLGHADVNVTYNMRPWWGMFHSKRKNADSSESPFSWQGQKDSNPQQRF